MADCIIFKTPPCRVYFVPRSEYLRSGGGIKSNDDLNFVVSLKDQEIADLIANGFQFYSNFRAGDFDERLTILKDRWGANNIREAKAYYLDGTEAPEMKAVWLRIKRKSIEIKNLLPPSFFIN